MKKIKLLKKPKKNNSFKWLDRHLNDEYFLKSKKEGFRSRSSYKLLQIDEKFQFLKKSKLILDLGCSPGGWLQVAQMNAPKDSMILGLDKLDLKKIDGVLKTIDVLREDSIFIDTIHGEQELSLDQTIELFNGIRLSTISSFFAISLLIFCF